MNSKITNALHCIVATHDVRNRNTPLASIGELDYVDLKEARAALASPQNAPAGRSPLELQLEALLRRIVSFHDSDRDHLQSCPLGTLRDDDLQEARSALAQLTRDRAGAAAG